MKSSLTLWLTGLGLLLSSCLALAQNHEGWYQIEVIIFKRPPLSDTEVWPKNISLSYPFDWQELKNPEAKDTETEEMENSDASPLEALVPAAVDNGAITGITATDEPLETIEVDLAREPFYKLPKPDRILNQIARKLSRRNGYRILFHEAWRQNVLGEGHTPSVLIFGGDTFGEHHELEGSINVNVARYLHVNTNLWFSEFQVNTGQSRNDWTELPQDPKKQLESISFDTENPTIPFLINPSTVNTISMIPSNSWRLDTAIYTLPDFLSSPYLPLHITTLQQNRRMRSNVLHFIDHPELGIIVKILRYKVPEELEEENL